MPKIVKTGKFRRTSSSTAKSKSFLTNTTKTTKKEEEGYQVIDDQQHQQPQTSILTPKPIKETIVASKSIDGKDKNNNKNDLIKHPQVSANNKKNVKKEKESKDESQAALLSKGQRKRLAKREQYVKKQQMILSTLQLKHTTEQSKRIDGLDALKDALLATMNNENDTDSTTAKQTSTNTNTTNNNNCINLSGKATVTKKIIIQQELIQLDLIRQHPQFIQNPFTTIQEHLQNTLSVQIEQQKVNQIVHDKQCQETSIHKKQIKKDNQKVALHTKTKKKKSKFKATRSKSR